MSQAETGPLPRLLKLRLANEFAEMRVPPLPYLGRDIVQSKFMPEVGYVVSVTWERDGEVTANIEAIHKCDEACDHDCDKESDAFLVARHRTGPPEKRMQDAIEEVMSSWEARYLPAPAPEPAPESITTPAEPEETSSNGWPSS